MSQTVPEQALAAELDDMSDPHTYAPDTQYTAAHQVTVEQFHEATAMAVGLHQLARLVEANPALVEPLSYAFSHMLAPINTCEQPRKVIAEVSRAALAVGGKVDKDFDDTHGGVIVGFGPVRMKVYAPRAAVCERVVVGTEQVTREVPDPEALAAVPTVTVTETVEKVEWRCTPLLADETGQAAA